MNWPADAIIKEIWASRITSYVWLSGLVVLTYDTILTFPSEVTHIWKSERWSLAKVLYLLLRYLGLFQTIVNTAAYSTVQLSVKRCQLFFVFSLSVGSNTALLLIVNGIMVLRLYALYERSSKVLCLLFFLFFGEFAVLLFNAIAFGKPIVDATFLAPPDTPILGCLTAPVLSNGIIFGWSFSIAIAVIYFLMTITKFLQCALEARRAGWRLRIPPLARAFIQDGTIYFLAVVVTLIAGAIVCSLVSGPFVVLYEPWFAVSLVAAGSRLILNLREAAVRNGLSGDSVFISDLRGLEPSLEFSTVTE